jgi:guanine deaminase
MKQGVVLKGQTLSFVADPFSSPPDDTIEHHADGAVWMADGLIKAVGPAGAVLAKAGDADVIDYGDSLISAGFVDCHAHYPQLGVIASYGAQLLEWLEEYTFPAESAFGDSLYARAAADFYLAECLNNGTTSASVYGTVHAQSVDAFFEAASARNMRMAGGKVMMDRNAPDNLRDTAQSSYDDSKALLEHWHGKGRNAYAITPRFAPTSTPGQLEAAGALWREHPSAIMQTHLSENADEIGWVRGLYPDAPDYLGVYERFGLTGEGAIFGHAIHLEPRERAVLAESGSAIAHCPTSNLFIGSGLFDLADLKLGAGIRVGLASDVAGGTSLSMFKTMLAAYEIAQLNGYSLHPAQAWRLATMDAAETMGMADKIGNLAPGMEADVIVINSRSTPLIAARVERAESLRDLLFAQIVLADERAIEAVYVAGEQIGGLAPA